MFSWVMATLTTTHTNIYSYCCLYIYIRIYTYIYLSLYTFSIHMLSVVSLKYQIFSEFATVGGSGTVPYKMLAPISFPRSQVKPGEGC